MFSFPMLVVGPFSKSFCDLFAFFAYMCVQSVHLWHVCQEDNDHGLNDWTFPCETIKRIRSEGISRFLQYHWLPVFCRVLILSLFSSVSVTLSLPLSPCLSLSLSQSLSGSDLVSVTLSASVSLSVCLSLFPLSLSFAAPFSLSLFPSLPHSFPLVQSVFSLSFTHSLSLSPAPSLSLCPSLSLSLSFQGNKSQVSALIFSLSPWQANCRCINMAKYSQLFYGEVSNDCPPEGRQLVVGQRSVQI